MAVRYKTRGFVFKKEDRGESDRVFSIFTDDFGRLDIFAKAIRKNNSKLRGGIDNFFVSEIEFIQGKNKKTLTDAVAIKKFNTFSIDLEKFKTVNGIGEILENFIKGQEKDEKVFMLLWEVMEKINTQERRHPLIYYYFLWNTLSLLGYHPEVQNCASCHEKLTPYNIFFSNKCGGTICKKCLGQEDKAQEINSDVVKILRLILKKDWQIISKLKIKSDSQKLLTEISESAKLAFCPAHC
jgi:DNA repair protein RecO (recombination protein O)